MTDTNLEKNKCTAKAPILELGDEFYDVVEPAQFPSHILRYKNEKWAKRLGLEFSDKDWIEHFAKFKAIENSLEKPLAQRYHGHQFRHYNPNIGDGRGFLFAQFDCQGKILDLGTKGSGQTPYSRRADGRLTLKGAVREVLATEYLEAHKVNTSKTFSVIETGEDLIRHDEPSPTRSAVLTRLNHSHIRIGTFQRLAFLNEKENIKKLLDYTCKYYYPQLSTLEGDEKIHAFLKETTKACAKTCAEWMMAGFVHGVLNSDNINITGESFDYGPFRVLPHYDPNFTAAYFDETGLYSYGRQPEAVYWDLQQLALSFHSFFDKPEDTFESLEIYPKVFSKHLIELFFKRLNLNPSNQVENNKLFSYAFEFLESSRLGFEEFFFDWFGGVERGIEAMKGKRKDYYKGEDFNQFFKQIEVFKKANPKLQENKYFQKEDPETLVIDEIEAIWKEIAEKDDWQPFYNKIDRIRKKIAY